MSSIYLLKSNVSNYSSFIQVMDDAEDSIMGLAMDQNWQPFAKIPAPIALELRKSDSGKKNYQFDISASLRPFFVLSETALEVLGDLFGPRGQVLPVVTDSKKKHFFGYYPTNALAGCFDKERSVYREAKKGLLIDKVVLVMANITDEYLFSVEEDFTRVFVTSAFKRRVEDAGLSGFDFSVEIETV